MYNTTVCLFPVTVITVMQLKWGVYMYKAVMVDDEIWALRGLQTIIRWNDYNIEICAACKDAEEALEAVKNYNPDVLFTDIRMPVTSGMELLDRVNENGNRMLTVIVSAYRDFDVAKEAIEKKVFSYLVKPLDRTEVRELAERIKEKLDLESDNKSECTESFDQKFGITLSENKTVAEIQKFLCENLEKKYSTKEIADRFFISEAYLYELFKKNTGITINGFLKTVKMNRAEKLLRETELQVREIAESLGYDDPGYFGKLFRAEYGVTPEIYRKK